MSLSHWTEQEETQDISRGSGGEVFSTLLQDLPPMSRVSSGFLGEEKFPGGAAGKAKRKKGEYMGVSINGGTQQPLVLLLKMIILGCFWGTPIFGNTHIWV